jgi:hypothetical protein
VLSSSARIDRIEEVRALRRVSEKTPILFYRKRIQRWTQGIQSRTRWLRIRSLPFAGKGESAIRRANKRK